MKPRVMWVAATLAAIVPWAAACGKKPGEASASAAAPGAAAATATSAAADPASAPAAIPATASSGPTESQKAAAMELFVAMRLPATVSDTAAAMIESEVSRNPGLTPFKDVMLQWLTKYMTWDAMAPELTKLYVATYSEGELKELTAFYRSPVGQKALTKMPELMQETAMIGAKLGQPHSEELKQAMTARSEELQKQAQASAGAPGTQRPPRKPAGSPKKPE
jgi:uncharacterized protein